jgi:hypothetical protein
MESQELDRIYNFLPITESIATGGQPTKEQFDIHIFISNSQTKYRARYCNSRPSQNLAT